MIRPITRKWIICAGVVAFGVYFLNRYQDKNWHLSFVPVGLGITEILYVKEESWGFGPGGNETGVIIYALPESIALKIQNQGARYLEGTSAKTDVNGDLRGIYDNWRPTPMKLEGSDADANAVMSYDVADYLNRYGFGIEIDPSVKQQINQALSTPGSFAAYGRIGVFIVSPRIRRAFYIYNG